jgi:DNA-binding transcriptional LysR family regulator
MDPVKLAHFLAVLETGHFARAARQLGLSQPAISKSIKALESSLGVQLFQRGQYGAQPTEFANRLARHARLIVAEGALARAEMNALRSATAGHLEIGASISFARDILPAAIERYRRRWPDVAISVDVGLSGSLFNDLLNGRLDFVISAPPTTLNVDEGLSQEYLLDEVDAFVVSSQHPLADQPEIGLADLLGFPWVVPKSGGRWEQIHALFASSKLPPPHRLVRTESTVLALRLLSHGPYICLLGRSIFAPEMEVGLLTELRLPHLIDKRPAFLTTRASTQSRLSAVNMITVLRDICSKLVAA